MHKTYLTMDIRNLKNIKKHIFFCNGEACSLNGAAEVTKAIRQEIKKQGLHGCIHTTKTLCNSRCHDAAIVIVYPNNEWYKNMHPSDAQDFVQNVIINDKGFHKLLYKQGEDTIHSQSTITV